MERITMMMMERITYIQQDGGLCHSIIASQAAYSGCI
jgi:hypothetical protein